MAVKQASYLTSFPVSSFGESFCLKYKQKLKNFFSRFHYMIVIYLIENSIKLVTFEEAKKYLDAINCFAFIINMFKDL